MISAGAPALFVFSVQRAAASSIPRCYSSSAGSLAGGGDCSLKLLAYAGISQAVESQRTSEYANSDSCPTLSTAATETKADLLRCDHALGVVCNGDSAAIEVLVYGPCGRDEVVDISSRRIIELDLYALHCITLDVKVQRRSGRARQAGGSRRIPLLTMALIYGSVFISLPRNRLHGPRAVTAWASLA
jgi:hypothetical protein